MQFHWPTTQGFTHHLKRSLGRNLRRNLQRCLCLCLGLLLSLVSLPGQAIAPPIRGVWLTTIDSQILFDPQQLSRGLKRLKQLNITTIYPSVWNGGTALYPSPIAQSAAGGQLPRDPRLKTPDLLADLVREGHRQGLRVIPWFEFGLMLPETSPIALEHPDWIAHRQDDSSIWLDGNEPRLWLNPAHPDVQQFWADMVRDVAQRYDIDGIQFDDHLGLPIDLGYDRENLAQYNLAQYNLAQSNPVLPPTHILDQIIDRAMGRQPQTSPPYSQLPTPNSPPWLQWRADRITDLLTQIRASLPRPLTLSISPNPLPFALNHYLQDWSRWVDQGLVDELIVQIYRPDRPRFQAELNHPSIQAAQQKIPTAIGILTGLRDRPVSMEIIRQQVELSQTAKLGVSFFFYETIGPRDPAFRKLLAPPTVAKAPKAQAD
jgi:uncharacterized lipoprotein YddW (UPF0748 family)